MSNTCWQFHIEDKKKKKRSNRETKMSLYVSGRRGGGSTTSAAPMRKHNQRLLVWKPPWRSSQHLTSVDDVGLHGVSLSHSSRSRGSHHEKRDFLFFPHLILFPALHALYTRDLRNRWAASLSFLFPAAEAVVVYPPLRQDDKRQPFLSD